jgi:hypothetical protein
MPQVYPEAIDLIGTSGADDWRLNPKRDASTLPAAAETLRERLLSPDTQQLMDRYQSADTQAISAQNKYKKLAWLAAMAGFAGVLLGTTALIASQFGLPRYVLTISALTQAFLVIVSIVAALLNASLQPFQTWQQQRAEAENSRISFFDDVAHIPPRDGEAHRMNLALSLEYFRRYQLDVQHDYYARRGAQHQINARRAHRWRIIALLLVIAGTASLLWSLKEQSWLPDIGRQALDQIPDRTELGQRLFLALGIWASALQNLLSAFSLISLDERNAGRYLTTAENLAALKAEPLEEARKAIKEQSIEDATRLVRDFVALVHDQISSEHREWIALRKVAPEMTLARLRQRRS